MLGNALNVSNNVQVTKAQKRDKKAERLRKLRETERVRREQTLSPLLPPPLFISPPLTPASFIDLYVALRQREQAASQQAWARAIAQCSLDTRDITRVNSDSGGPREHP